VIIVAYRPLSLGFSHVFRVMFRGLSHQDREHQ